MKKSLVSKFNRIPKSLLAVCLIAGTLPFQASRCTNADVNTALSIAASNSAQLASRAESIYGATDARAKRVREWSGKIKNLQTGFANATTREEQVKLLPVLNASLDFFDTDILPFLKLSPTSQLIALAIEDGLRIVANHIVKTSADVIAQAPSTVGVMADATGVDVAGELARLRVQVTKHLRCRDAVTGRFTKMEQCQAHPESTVIERVK